MKIIQIYILFLIFLSIASNVEAQQNIQKAIEIFVEDPVNKNAAISIHVINLENGNEIAAYKSDLAITSASTTKLFSTAAAYELLGPQYRASTRIYTDGNITSDGILQGNLWLRGGGDVSLGSKYFNQPKKELDFLNSWADSLSKLGIKFIQGALIADASDFGYAGVPDGWDWNDIGNYYGSPARGLNIYDNLVKVNFRTFSPGTKSAIVSIFPEVSGLRYKNNVYSANVNGDNSYLYGAPFSLDRSAEGKLPAHQSSFEVKGSLPDPELQTAFELQKALANVGIQTEDGCRTVRTNSILSNRNYNKMNLLIEYFGKTVDEIAYWTNLKSVNLFAEGLLNQLGYYLSGDGCTATSLQHIYKFLEKNIDTKGLVLTDGSGLSRSNAISASHFTSLLNYMWHSKNIDSFKKTLPVAGVSGTLKNLCKEKVCEGKVVAKSGTISGVKSYAGYVESTTGKKLAFAITVNNFNCSSTQISDKMEKILVEMAQY
ncbi:MAG: D-alanyl-D-alanine carboxypeptidase/D-alanyl-D-alanine-endopeptidase [Bacteroidetes bacterium]|nr:D-alanyl-D-alanine carboxypeptidase/D-alanyl-D-alanine-endopeptidase [Bacteroidota bacterium]